MALIKCPECGKEVSNQTDKCINCGYPFSKLVSTDSMNTVKKETERGSPVVYGYTGWFLVKPKLKIYINGNYIGDVSYKSRTTEISISEPSTVEIKCGIRCTSVRVLPGVHNEIHTQFDRTTGSIIAEVMRY